MTSRLIINADDFGLTPGINRVIAELYRGGVLSSATVMANGAAFRDACLLAGELPGLGVGCHVVLVDGTPVSDPQEVSSLLGGDGLQFRSSLGAFAQAALLGRLKEEQIEREATAQVQRLLAAGIQPTHLDSHKHTHMFPAVLRPLLRVAERFGIPAIRNPFEQRWSVHVGKGRLVRRLQIRVLALLERGFHAQPSIREGRVRTTKGAIGVSATGELDGPTLEALLAQLPDGTWEFVCHPGVCDEELSKTRTRLRGHREIERDALLSIVPGILASGRTALVSFAALGEELP